MLIPQHNKGMLDNPQLENSYNKVIAVIESCKTKEQLESASKMVDNFKELYGKVGYPKALSYNLDPNTAQLVYVPASTLMPEKLF